MAGIGATGLTMIWLIAHQGGWDEALFVGVPIIVFGVLLAVSNRRANRQRE